ncbi:hypothetical protein HELRODRAFT_175983 [Helobdella robusta]|uniref:Uncharacterized protein n=1 Tax=Helobdella robusta TaxID=6412 RepID=T1FA01_HELRO|nr:hypothetical protein HELRODRAFT_175983 [Helobdella robusta]ESO00163.1 hypothetical protein HELRODRAFT_175983 [Helobdella robusta]
MQFKHYSICIKSWSNYLAITFLTVFEQQFTLKMKIQESHSKRKKDDTNDVVKITKEPKTKRKKVIKNEKNLKVDPSQQGINASFSAVLNKLLINQPLNKNFKIPTKTCGRTFGNDLKNINCGRNLLETNKPSNSKKEINKSKCPIVTSTPIIMLEDLNLIINNDIRNSSITVDTLDLNDCEKEHEHSFSNGISNCVNVIPILSPVLSQAQLDNKSKVDKGKQKCRKLKKKVSDIMQQHLSIIESTKVSDTENLKESKNLQQVNGVVGMNPCDKIKSSEFIKGSKIRNRPESKHQKQVSDADKMTSCNKLKSSEEEKNENGSFRLFEMDRSDVNTQQKYSKKKAVKKTVKASNATEHTECFSDNHKARKIIKKAVGDAKKREHKLVGFILWGRPFIMSICSHEKNCKKLVKNAIETKGTLMCVKSNKTE